MQRRSENLIRNVLDAIRAQTRDGVLVDSSTREAFIRAHELDEDAQVRVLFGPPANDRELSLLRRLANQGFGGDLPPDYLFFLRRHDGLNVSPSERILTTEQVLSLLDQFRVAVTMPSGVETVEYGPVFPFFEVDDLGWHGFEFTDTVRIVGYDEGTVLPLAAGSFTEWLEKWWHAGCTFSALEDSVSVSRESERIIPAALNHLVPLANKWRDEVKRLSSPFNMLGRLPDGELQKLIADIEPHVPAIEALGRSQLSGLVKIHAAALEHQKLRVCETPDKSGSLDDMIAQIDESDEDVF